MHNSDLKLSNADTSISIESLSTKQLLGECLELSTEMFKQIVEAFTNINHFDPPFTLQQKVDFSMLLGYMLDPARTDKIITQFVSEADKNNRGVARSGLFELKSMRNIWAHTPGQAISYRHVNRAFDTLSMVFEAFKGDPNSPLFLKIESYRKKLLIATARKYLHEMGIK